MIIIVFSNASMNNKQRTNRGRSVRREVSSSRESKNAVATDAMRRTREAAIVISAALCACWRPEVSSCVNKTHKRTNVPQFTREGIAFRETTVSSHFFSSPSLLPSSFLFRSVALLFLSLALIISPLHKTNITSSRTSLQAADATYRFPRNVARRARCNSISPVLARFP